MNPESLLLESFDCAVETALPSQCLQSFIPQPPKGRMIVIGAGKASAAMAAAFETHYKAPLEGLVITRYDHAVPTQHIKILEAAHPVPDEAGLKAVQQLINLLETAGPDDLIVCLLSGGGSSLLARPVKGVSFEELQALQTELLGSGAAIDEVNIVRKHLNIALGGGLLKAAPNTPFVTLSISDVVGDDPSVIASGPTVADASTLADAQDVLIRYDIHVPDSVMKALRDSANETVKPDDPLLKKAAYNLIATPKASLKAAQSYWTNKGFDAEIWNADFTGDSEDAALHHVAYCLSRLYKLDKPLAIISGGETTMSLEDGHGKGGPNSHFMLRAALALEGNKHIYAMACDTDGIDGYGGHAGAFITPETLSKAHQNNLPAYEFLSAQDSHTFFDKLDQLVKTGPSYTNVNDYRVFLLLP